MLIVPCAAVNSGPLHVAPQAEPQAYGELGLADLLEMREECLREFGFRDVYRCRRPPAARLHVRSCSCWLTLFCERYHTGGGVLTALAFGTTHIFSMCSFPNFSAVARRCCPPGGLL